MAQITVKYKYGQRVSYSGLPCRITGIVIRGRGRMYELGYLDNNGNPAGCTAQECEIGEVEPDDIGFGRKEKK